MWKCSKCGAECDGDVCTVCGQSREEEINEVTEEVAEEVTEEVAEEVTEEAAEEVTEEAAEEAEAIEGDEGAVDLSKPSEEIEMPTSWVCPACGEENEGELCEKCGEVRPESYNIVDFVPKKKNGKVIALAALVVAVVVITASLFIVFAFNRNLSRSGENHLATYEDILGTCDSIWGDDVILKINGIEVPTYVFESYLTNTGLYYQSSYISQTTGQYDPTLLEKFKWTNVADKKTGQTHREIVIEDTLNDCIEIYTLLSLGEKYNIKVSQESLDAIDKEIEQYKNQYGDGFKTTLELNGYKSEKQFRELLELDALVSAVVTDLNEHPERYIGEDRSVYAMEDPISVSAKHILIKVDDEKTIKAAQEAAQNGETDEPQTFVDDKTAKKQAEKVLKEIKDGKDFDKLIKEYNQDSGQPEQGYTFTKGQMAEEFEKAAFALKPDEVSGLVKTNFGYHIIKRIITVTDVVNYEKSEAKVYINRGLLKNMEVKSDLAKILQ